MLVPVKPDDNVFPIPLDDEDIVSRSLRKEKGRLLGWNSNEISEKFIRWTSVTMLVSGKVLCKPALGGGQIDNTMICGTLGKNVILVITAYSIVHLE